MRSLKSRLFGFGVAAFFGTIVVVGCSASGGDGDLSEIDGNEPDQDASKILPTTPEDGDDSGTDPKKDAGKKDASAKDGSAKDASSLKPAPETGDPCTTVDEEFTRGCGKCGSQKALCLANGKVSDYNTCKDAADAECEPGTTEDIACGNCGKVTRTCSKYCAWTQGGCSGQPTNSCSPGSVQFTDASCGPSTYKFKTCQNTCTWGTLTQTCAAPPTSISAPPTIGSTNTTLVVLKNSQTMSRIPYTSVCPVSTTATWGSATAYTYIEVKNPNPKATTVSIYTTKDPATSTSFTTYLASYDGATGPTTESARRQCKSSVGSATSGAYGHDVTIPPNGSVSVLVQAYSPLTADSTLLLNVQTDTVAP